MCYYVGIDVAKFKHDFTIVTSDGEVILQSTTFKNDFKGFETIKDSLANLDHSQEIKIGLESTGHYHKNLVKFLTEQGYQVSILNPYLVHGFIKSRTLRKQKTDNLDCLWIAKDLQSEDFKAYQSKLYPCEELKSLTRSRNKIVRERSNQLVVVTNCLDRIFPEFKGFFDGKLSKSALVLLFEHSTVDSIKALTASKIQKIKDKHKGIRIGKYFEIRDAAKITIGVPNDSTSFIMKQAISQIFTFDKILNSYDERIDKIMDEQNSVLESIPGVGRNSASVILAEYNNFQGFPDADKLLAYAGLECSRYQSGESDYHGHMVKRGSPFLRYTLMNLAIALKNHNAVFKEYYLKKRDEGKRYRVALNHVVRKFLRVAFKLVSTNQKFNIDQ